MAKKKNYEEQVKGNPGALVEKLIKEIAGLPAIDMHFEDEDDGVWAVVKVHDYDADTEMSLRLLPESKWVLQFGYYDEEDEFIELLQPLGQAEVGGIPNGLQKAMLKVLVSEEGMRVPGSLLTK